MTEIITNNSAICDSNIHSDWYYFIHEEYNTLADGLVIRMECTKFQVNAKAVTDRKLKAPVFRII